MTGAVTGGTIRDRRAVVLLVIGGLGGPALRELPPRLGAARLRGHGRRRERARGRRASRTRCCSGSPTSSAPSSSSPCSRGSVPGCPGRLAGGRRVGHRRLRGRRRRRGVRADAVRVRTWPVRHRASRSRRTSTTSAASSPTPGCTSAWPRRGSRREATGPTWFRRTAWWLFWVGGVVSSIAYQYVSVTEASSGAVGIASASTSSFICAWIVALSIYAATAGLRARDRAGATRSPAGPEFRYFRPHPTRGGARMSEEPRPEGRLRLRLPDDDRWPDRFAAAMLAVRGRSSSWSRSCRRGMTTSTAPTTSCRC